MDLIKHYIVQCVSTAANNLRLSSAKIEMVAILREFFEKSDKPFEDIKRLKQITEMSKLAIKLGQIYSSLENNKIDFLKISDKFKTDSYSIVKELSNMLDLLTPDLLRKKINPYAAVDIDLSKRTTNSDSLDHLDIKPTSPKTEEVVNKNQQEEIRENFIFDDLEDLSDFNFEQYEETILKEIKYMDAFLLRLANYDYETNELLDYVKMMKKNAELSNKAGFEILFNMHKTFYTALEQVNDKKIIPDTDVIESMRACLIVIVAVVRDKDVDITGYLNKAELFGRKILGKKKEE